MGRSSLNWSSRGRGRRARVVIGEMEDGVAVATRAELGAGGRAGTEAGKGPSEGTAAAAGAPGPGSPPALPGRTLRASRREP